MAGYRVAVDVGGTFTDVFVVDEQSGAIKIAKVPSTPNNPADGIIKGVEQSGVPVPLITLFSHGTTVGTNALITRNFPRVALITTKGFRDVLEIRRGTKQYLWDAYADVAPPYIRRRDRFEVDERIDSDGREVTPLNEAACEEVARIIRRRGIQSVAVCFINAYVDGRHECRVREILEASIPDVSITISSEIIPEIFEFERESTTVANAVLSPVVSRYMDDLAHQLKDRGFRQEVLVLHSGGGVLTAKTVGRYAARIAASGLAGGAVAMSHIAKLCGFDNAMGLDMGGTSTDISLMWQGQLRMTRDWYVEYGYPIRFPSIELITIGAGGGSMGWIDEGGALRNGPQSAGAVPGPASYGLGGTQPTNTDANLVLGRLGPELLSGQMKLNRQAAERAMNVLGDRLGMTARQAADATIRVANANMCDALRIISIQRGFDPRDFALVAFGGAGPLHAVEVAREMHIPTVIIPVHPGITSAVGCLLVDIRHDIVRTIVKPMSDELYRELDTEFEEMEREALELLENEGINRTHAEFQRYMEMRYVGQWRSLMVRVPEPAGPTEVMKIFHREYQREYAFSQPDQPVELFGLAVSAIGHMDLVEVTPADKGSLRCAEPVGTRSVFFSGDEFIETPIYVRQELAVGNSIVGPAVVEQLDSTTIIPPAASASVDQYRNLIIHV